MNGGRMSLRRRRDDREIGEEGDTFETEGLAFLNEQSETDKHKVDDDDSDVNLEVISDESDIDDDMHFAEPTESDSDNEAPESVGFDAIKQNALQQLRTANKQIGGHKEKRRLQRQKLDEQFKEQKAKKLEELSKARLPDHVLEELDDEIPKKKKKRSEKKKKTLKNEPDDDLDVKADDILHPAGDMGDDFLPLKTDCSAGLQVVPLAWTDKKTKTLAEAATNFRQSRLYGSHIARETNKDRLAKAEKRRARFVR